MLLFICTTQFLTCLTPSLACTILYHPVPPHIIVPFHLNLYRISCPRPASDFDYIGIVHWIIFSVWLSKYFYHSTTPLPERTLLTTVLRGQHSSMIFKLVQNVHNIIVLFRKWRQFQHYYDLYTWHNCSLGPPLTHRPVVPNHVHHSRCPFHTCPYPNAGHFTCFSSSWNVNAYTLASFNANHIHPQLPMNRFIKSTKPTASTVRDFHSLYA